MAPKRRHSSKMKQQVPPIDEASPREWKHFVSVMDVHGLGQIEHSRATWSRKLWILLFIVAILVLACSVFESVQQFMFNPIMTTYSIKAMSQMPFPSIYICPMNSMDNSKIAGNNFTAEKIDSMIANYLKIVEFQGKGMKAKGAKKFFGVIRAEDVAQRAIPTGSKISASVGHSWKPAKPASGTVNKTGNETEDSDETRYFSCPPPSDVRPNNITYPNETVQEFFIRIGFDTAKFFAMCSFGAERFSCSSVTKEMFDGDTGKCFAMNLSGWKQHEAGLGLTLLMDLNTEDYPVQVRGKAFLEGVSIRIGDTIDPTSANSFLVQPGLYTKIEIERRSIKLTNTSIGTTAQHCVGKGRPLAVLSIPYSQSSCRIDCAVEAVLASCDCLLGFDSTLLHEKFRKVRVCSTSNDSECISGVISNMREGTKNGSTTTEQSSSREGLVACAQDCMKPCEMVDFALTASYATFPSDGFVESVDLHGQQFSKDHDETEWYDDPEYIAAKCNRRSDIYTWKYNYALVDIAYGHMLTLTQQPSMTFNMFISNIGGQFGLWIGASLFTLIQLVVFVVSTCWIKCRSNEVDGSRSPQHEDNYGK